MTKRLLALGLVLLMTASARLASADNGGDLNYLPGDTHRDYEYVVRNGAVVDFTFNGPGLVVGIYNEDGELQISHFDNGDGVHVRFHSSYTGTLTIRVQNNTWAEKWYAFSHD